MTQPSEETRFFFELTPDRILDAVELFGVRCTGRCLALNSMENRVFELEIEVPEEEVQTPSDRFRVVKFYRPGRWTKEQLLEEHAFMLELDRAEVSVVPPLKDSDGNTLRTVEGTGIWYALFPKVGGRCTDELNKDQLELMGRLLGRLHAVGKAEKSKHRLHLNAQTYGLASLEYLLQSNSIPDTIRDRYTTLVKEISRISAERSKNVAVQRIHGDCHQGNVIWATKGPRVVDFDDMVVGPCVQDLWLLIPGRDENAQKALKIMLDAYELMNKFDRTSLDLIECLRSLRMIHYTAWVARRWHDPAFQRTFPQFGSPEYWRSHLIDLEEQLMLLQGESFL